MADVILFAHPTFGVLGILASVWVFVEALNASDANRQRLCYASLAVTLFIVAAWLLGGYWYTHFYRIDRQMILQGPVPWAHSFFMETKEHLFFVTLVLALYLPLVTRVDLTRSAKARLMTLAVSAMIVLSGLALEGAGALINFGAKAAYVARVPA